MKKEKVRGIHRRQRKDATLPDKEGKSKKTARLFSTAIFAGGCFWCVESAFEVAQKTIAKGIINVESGYSGGKTKKPSYMSHEGHLESVQVTFNPEKTKYKQLLEIFWQNIDPTDEGGQFGDRGHSYTTAIFYSNPKQKKTGGGLKESFRKIKEVRQTNSNKNS